MATVSEALAAGQRLHQQGDLARAEQIYRQVLQQAPGHADALHLLGLVALQAGQAAAARDLIRQAIAAKEHEAAYHNNLGLACKTLQQLDEARAAFGRAVELAPAFAEAHANLGTLLKDLGEHAAAAVHLRRAVELRPDNAVMAYNLANGLLQQGQAAEALPWYDRALQLRPNYPEALNNKGRVLEDLGRPDEALVHYSAALQARPGFTDALVNRGQLLQRRGQLAEAAALLRPALQSAPQDVRLLRCLGNVLVDAGRWEEALPYLRQAVAQDAKQPESHHSLALAVAKLGQLDESAACCREALRLKPDYVEAYNSLAAALVEQGLLSEAISNYREAVRRQPDWQGAQSNVLLALNYLPDAAPAWLLEQHRAWAATLPATPVEPHANVADPERRLRIGYVSADFRLHPVAHFIEPILMQHDPAQVEVFAYSQYPQADSVTQRLRQRTHHWRVIHEQSDEQVAGQIRADAIDILVDLSGHTGGNRLPVFARRPAPVQASWLGYPNTTGLDAVDYRLSDAVADPPGEARHHTEELVRLESGFCCYLPPSEAPAVSPLPARVGGGFTFGALHNLAKLNDGVLDAWSRILQAVPGSRLLLFRNTLTAASQQRLRQEFARRGVAADRLDLRQQSLGNWGYLRVYHDIDLVLDAWPWSSHTTACEALWLGVPVLTLRGTRHAGRMCASILTRLGLSALIAETMPAYESLAVSMAGDLERLAELRRGLRPRMQASPLCDGRGLTRCLEDAYRAMWQRWCAGHD